MVGVLPPPPPVAFDIGTNVDPSEKYEPINNLNTLIPKKLSHIYNPYWLTYYLSLGAKFQVIKLLEEGF